jgi:hypothetical protein
MASRKFTGISSSKRNEEKKKGLAQWVPVARADWTTVLILRLGTTVH